MKYAAGAILIVSVLGLPNTASAQTPLDQAMKNIGEGFLKARCDSFVIVSTDRSAATPVMNLLAAWSDGYARGVAMTLFATMQDPSKQIIREMEAEKMKGGDDGMLVTAAAIVANTHGDPPLLKSVSMETRLSMLMDYCHEHREQTIIDAVGKTLFKWLDLPKGPGK